MVRGSQARSTAGAQESALEMELAPAGGPLQRAMRLSHQHFPTESLSNMLRPLGLADGHALHDVFNLVTLPLLVYECCRYLSRGDRFDEFLLITYVRDRSPFGVKRGPCAHASRAHNRVCRQPPTTVYPRRAPRLR
jgi:hypothetical protein